jgi:hypothetical protein
MARTAMVDAGPSSYPCGVTYAGAVYWHEKGDSADGERETLVKGLWPDIANQRGPVSLTLTARKFPQSDDGDDEPPVTYGPFSMAPGTDRVDFKATGRLFRVRFESSSSPSRWRLGRITFEAKLRGRK